MVNSSEFINRMRFIRIFPLFFTVQTKRIMGQSIPIGCQPRPTYYVLTTKFHNVQIIRCGNIRMLKKPLTLVQQAYLRTLGLIEEIFISSLPPPFPIKSSG